MDWDSENKLIASGSNDKSIRISTIDSLSMLPPMKGHSGTIRCVQFREPCLGTSILASAGMHNITLTTIFYIFI
jgi:WD40 repeat protein